MLKKVLRSRKILCGGLSYSKIIEFMYDFLLPAFQFVRFRSLQQRDFKIFVSLIFPMLKPALATVGLFLALGYWNEWYLSSLYLNSSVTYKPLQYYLYQIINTANALKNSVAGANVSVADLPSNTLKMATAVVATGPIIFLYPFVQKYFISGITVGAVKG